MKGWHVMRHGALPVLVGALLVMLAGCSAETTTETAGGGGGQPVVAIAELSPTAGHSVSGTVTFTLTDEGVRVGAVISGLEPGKHGFHIHEIGDCSASDGSSAGGHFNPKGTPHAGADSEVRHIGDLGNLEADFDGKAIYDRIDYHLAFEGEANIIGRSVIVHELEDDLTTQPTGGAGARLACGVIEISN